MSRSSQSRLARAVLAAALAGALVAPSAGAAVPGASSVAPAVRAWSSSSTTTVRWQRRDGVGSFWRVTRMTRNGYVITRFEGYSCVISCTYEGPTYVRTVGHGNTFWFLQIGGKLIPM